MDARAQKAIVLAAVFGRDGARCYDCRAKLSESEAVLVDVPVEDEELGGHLLTRARALCVLCARQRRHVAQPRSGATTHVA